MSIGWWKTRPLNESESKLMALVLEAHHQSVFRENISSMRVASSALGSSDFGKAVASAVLTLGGIHAPIKQVMRLLSYSDPAEIAREALAKGLKIPGWGGSFAGSDGDQIWSEVAAFLKKNCKHTDAKIAAITDVLWKAGKEIMPNPACYTAATALVLQIPDSVASWLFIQGRLEGWAQIFLTNESVTLWE